jgi:YVTN family beta-propeller protein
VAGDLARVYVPHIQSNDVYVIDPATLKVIDKFKVGLNPQHVVPSYDLRTLWVANNAENTTKGSLTPVDPTTGKPGKAIPVDDPYNMYFSPDGKSAIVVAEAMKRLDFRDPKTMQLQYSIDVPRCAGINHAEFSIDGSFAIFTCEFSGTVAKIDLVQRKVLGYTQVIQPGRPTKIVKGPDGRDEVICTTWKGMPQDIRASPDGKTFFVADMMADGVHVVDGESLAPDRLHRDRQRHARPLSEPRRQEALRGQSRLEQDPRAPKGKGGVSVIDFATRKVEANWPIPGGGSPDMGNVSADGKTLWLSGRYDNVVMCSTHERRGHGDTGRQGAARTDRMAAAGSILARPHRQSALTGLALWTLPRRAPRRSCAVHRFGYGHAQARRHHRYKSDREGDKAPVTRSRCATERWFTPPGNSARDHL